MQITLQYETQLKRAVGAAAETVDVPEDSDVARIVKLAAVRHGGAVQDMLLDSEGNVRSSVLIFAGDRQVAGDEVLAFTGGETLTLMSPISGG